MELLRRIWYLFNRRRLERELTEEMEAHRELMARDGQREFGNGLRLREDTREVWGWAWLDCLWQDLAYGARILRKSPGFTVTSILILAVGIGVTLGSFRLMLQQFRPSNVPDPDTMTHLQRSAPGMRSSAMANPMMRFYAANARSFRSVMGEYGATVLFGSVAEPVRVAFVTANSFAELGTKAEAGRLLSPAIDELPGSEAAALLSRQFAEHIAGSAAAAVGQTIRLNGKPVRVVGVVPGTGNAARSIRVGGQGAYSSTVAWIPLAQQPYVVEGSTLLTDWTMSIWVTARLRPGVTPAAAEAESLALAAKLREAHPDNVDKGESLLVTPITRIDARDLAPALLALTLVLLVLMVACANLGTLLLARGLGREREIRTRMALGAGRWRVVRQLFTESLLLASLGALTALALSTATLRILESQSGIQESWSATLDWRVLGATVVAALLTVSIFGLAPALRLTGSAPHGGRARTVFLAAQVGASCVLLMVSGLLVRGFQRLTAMDPGFDYRQVAVIDPDIGSHGYKGAAALEYVNNLRARLLAIPGVLRVSTMEFPPWGKSFSGQNSGGHHILMNHVDTDFIQTLGVRLVLGRNFRQGEQNAAIVSEPVARWLWPGEDPLGKTLKLVNGGTVIGVVENAGTFDLRSQETWGSTTR